MKKGKKEQLAQDQVVRTFLRGISKIQNIDAYAILVRGTNGTHRIMSGDPIMICGLLDFEKRRLWCDVMEASTEKKSEDI